MKFLFVFQWDDTTMMMVVMEVIVEVLAHLSRGANGSMGSPRAEDIYNDNDKDERATDGVGNNKRYVFTERSL